MPDWGKRTRELEWAIRERPDVPKWDGEAIRATCLLCGTVRCTTTALREHTGPVYHLVADCPSCGMEMDLSVAWGHAGYNEAELADSIAEARRVIEKGGPAERYAAASKLVQAEIRRGQATPPMPETDAQFDAMREGQRAAQRALDRAQAAERARQDEYQRRRMETPVTLTDAELAYRRRTGAYGPEYQRLLELQQQAQAEHAAAQAALDQLRQARNVDRAKQRPEPTAPSPTPIEEMLRDAPRRKFRWTE